MTPRIRNRRATQESGKRRAPSRALWLVTWLVSTTPSHAAYESDCGFSRLAEILGPAMPTGSGISVATIESGPAYLPQSGSGTFPGSGAFTGRTFTAKSGTSSLSLHAERVGYHLYGPFTSSASGWATMAPGITLIDCYETNSWTDNAFLRPGPSNAAPLTELRSIQNHSWIEYASAATATTYNDFLRRLDFAIHRDGFLCTTAVNNAAGNATPELMASAFNSLSVGLSNGNHSTGPTSSLVDAPGRLKPEIVAPFDATSWATPYVASASALLRQRANASATPNASRPESIKAFLLAGATKSEFPGWSKSATVPLDATFGAGELDIALSDSILSGTRQSPNLPTPRPHAAWGFVSLASGTADFLLDLPPGTFGTELSAFLVWHRTLTDPAGGSFNLSPDPIADFNLALDILPVSSAPAIPIDQSTSSIYNLEHVWKKNLPAARYRLRISRTPGTARDCAIAWRLHSAPLLPTLTPSHSGNSGTLSASSLIQGQSCRIDTSTDLLSWSPVHSFIASSSSATYSEPATPGTRYYRLALLSR